MSLSSKPKHRPPAHQNTFAFRHNKNSQTTKRIYALPAEKGCCRRCADIINWRRQYRKYRPLKVPTKCLSCEERCVRLAYHVLCEDCSTRLGECAKCRTPLTSSALVASKTAGLEAELDELTEHPAPGLSERQRRSRIRELQREIERVKTSGEDPAFERRFYEEDDDDDDDDDDEDDDFDDDDFDDEDDEDDEDEEGDDEDEDDDDEDDDDDDEDDEDDDEDDEDEEKEEKKPAVGAARTKSAPASAAPATSAKVAAPASGATKAAAPASSAAKAEETKPSTASRSAPRRAPATDADDDDDDDDDEELAALIAALEKKRAARRAAEAASAAARGAPKPEAGASKSKKPAKPEAGATSAVARAAMEADVAKASKAAASLMHSLSLGPLDA